VKWNDQWNRRTAEEIARLTTPQIIAVNVKSAAVFYDGAV
jgi:hypothetical protein